MSLSRFEAVVWAVMVGASEAYFTADGVRLGATPLELGLLVALPLAIGSFGPIAVVWALGRWPHRKPLVVGPVLGQVASLSVLAVAEWYRAVTPGWLIVAATAHQVFGQASAISWSSWYADVVPARMRGRYFSRRNGWAHFATCLALLGSGLCLEWLEPAGAGDASAGGGRGFCAIFALAAIARAVSAVLLSLSPEPRFAGLADLKSSIAHFRSPEGLAARRLVVIGSLLSLAVYVGSPYFAPFQLEVLRFSYAEYTASTLMVVLAKFFMLQMWGRAVDRHGARSIFLLAAVGVAVVPVPFIFADGIKVVLAAQALSGTAWGGYEVAQFSLMLETTDARVRPSIHAALNLLTGFAQLLGSLLGGAILESSHGYQLVFAASTMGRLAIAIALAPLVPATRPGFGRRHVLLRLMGFRVSGGAAQASMPVDDEK